MSEAKHISEEDRKAIVRDIEKLVRAEVGIELEKEQKLLKDSVVLAAKIVGAAITVFFAMFTVFGLTTWSDIKKETIQIVKKQAEELIQRADSETSIKNTLTDLLNRTVISSTLAAHARGPSHEITLSVNDWERLRTWIKREDLPLQDFMDTLAVLDLQTDDRKKTDANRLLSEMLSPPEKSPYNWISKQPEKTEAILSNFKHKDLGSSAVDLVASPAHTDSVRAKAAIYVREVGYLEGVDKLLSTYRTLNWSEVKQNALMTCVMLRPDWSEVVGELKRLLAEGPRSEKIDAVVKIITILPQLKIGSSELMAVSKDALLYATRNGLIFDLVSYYSVITSIETQWVTLFLATSSDPLLPLVPVGRLTFSEFKDFKPYWQLLSELANAGDMEQLRYLFPHERGLESSYIRKFPLAISADRGAIAIVEEKGLKKELDLENLVDASVLSIGFLSSAKAQLTWFENTGNGVKAQLIGLKGKNFKFSLKEIKPSK